MASVTASWAVSAVCDPNGLRYIPSKHFRKIRGCCCFRVCRRKREETYHKMPSYIGGGGGGPAAADIIWAWIVILVEGVADRDFSSLLNKNLFIYFFLGSSFCCHRNKTTDVPWLLQSLLLFLLLPSSLCFLKLCFFLLTCGCLFY